MLKWILAALALAGVLSGTVLAFRSNAPKTEQPLLDLPVKNPFLHSISGAGLIEPASENVVIGVTEPGRVTNVYVKKGQQVKKGDPLFKTDTGQLENELLTAEAAVKSAEAELERVKAFRRKEDEPILRAKVAQAEAALAEAQVSITDAQASVAENEANLKDQQARMKRWEATVASGASPEELLDQARYAVAMANARVTSFKVKVQAAQAREVEAKAILAQAKAELETYLSGAWLPDVKRAEAALTEARSRVERIRRDIERRTVRAPLDSSVLRLNLREGEYATVAMMKAEDAPLVLGNLDVLHVRVDIDEYSASDFKPGMKATMFAKSDRDKAVPLKFVSVEPFIVPKRALTNSQRELVDTRVLQVIYKIDATDPGVYVGQQVDVFFEREEAVSGR
ncbi:MAG TPA: biotin/lipoyl-binding protein [Planctomycetota bacterium]|nr:biotin/lipoyl-binding protein [Planctomycetota bacterium]